MTSLRLKMASKFQNEGTCAYFAKDYATALFKFTETIRIEPKKHDLYLQRSSVYRLRSEFQESSSDASKAIYLSPNSYEEWVYREIALEGLGKPVAARDAHTRTI
ncbi:uncharacterized protein ASPGLDRAFT_865121 [Aspergillus glaucus CBS 516.65]|uniref:Uncharacterized protein n=1 Tax=Aspergillus glaucus CBS 516.65 TaxID=1160497 RepID=A0A1L9V8T1_ASPGL|nr:hypothetical protein ASPGLDRAFT_865121 [Aspergillus glaucus CBS 516.65]OJJ80347.1 hypothetical protein ASPGLDRAFT_865121 [Aspergillus glaucus CBS 516.65]